MSSARIMKMNSPLMSMYAQIGVLLPVKDCSALDPRYEVDQNSVNGKATAHCATPNPASCPIYADATRRVRRCRRKIMAKIRPSTPSNKYVIQSQVLVAGRARPDLRHDLAAAAPDA